MTEATTKVKNGGALTTEKCELTTLMSECEKSLRSISELLASDFEKISQKKMLLGELKDSFCLSESSSSNQSKLIQLNVGGENMTISRNSVERISETNLLFKLISGKYDHLLPKDKNGRIFLDY